MHPELKHFLYKSFVITCIVIAIASGLFYFGLKEYYFGLFPVLLFTFPMVSLTVHYQLLKALRKTPAQFNVAFMSGFMIKLFVYAGITGLVIYIHPGFKKSIVITVFALYIIYTVFETREILANIKKIKRSEK